MTKISRRQLAIVGLQATLVAAPAFGLTRFLEGAFSDQRERGRIIHELYRTLKKSWHAVNEQNPTDYLEKVSLSRGGTRFQRKKIISSDFQTGNTMDVSGLVLSRTEVALAIEELRRFV